MNDDHLRQSKLRAAATMMWSGKGEEAISKFNSNEAKLEINGSRRRFSHSTVISSQFSFHLSIEWSRTPFSRHSFPDLYLSTIVLHAMSTIPHWEIWRKKNEIRELEFCRCVLSRNTHVVRLFSIEQRWKKKFNFTRFCRNQLEKYLSQIGRRRHVKCHYNGTLNSSLCHTPFQ